MAKAIMKKQDAKPEKKPSVFDPSYIKACKEAKNKAASKQPGELTDKEKNDLDRLINSMRDSEIDSILKNGYSFNQGTIIMEGRHIICMTVVKAKGGKEEEDEDDDGLPKAPSAKQIKEIQKEIKDSIKLMLTLPPPAFTKINPALKISSFNASDICTYTIDKLIRIAPIPVFATGSIPTIAAVQLVYDNLLPLAGVKTNTLNASDKNNKKVWTKQLKSMLIAMAASCAGLANGNLSMYLLTGFGVKRAAVQHDAQLDACVFRLTTNHGGNIIGVDCDPLAYAKNYTIYYSNLAIFSMLTANQQTGPSRQLLEELTGGDMMTILMVANGKKLKGKIANPQTRRVPFD
jgi:hypothetical protein